MNGFNVRSDGYDIFKGLNENPGFMRVWLTIVAVQFAIVNCSLIPLGIFKAVGAMFSCVPFGSKGWIAVILLSATMIPVDLLRKAIAGSAKKA